MSAVPPMAINFETLAHTVVLKRKGCRARLASQRMRLLHAIPHIVMKAKRTSSARVVRRFCPKVQYLLSRKLLIALYCRQVNCMPGAYLNYWWGKAITDHSRSAGPPAYSTHLPARSVVFV